MSVARALPALITLLLTSVLVCDVVFNQRGTDVLLIPGLVLVVMAAASLTILLSQPPILTNTHSVAPIVVSQHGRLVGMGFATLLVLIVPRIGIPILTVSIAHYRGADFKTALLLGAGAAAMIEVIFITVLGLSFPPVNLW